MNYRELTVIVQNEQVALSKMLTLLEEQYELIMKKKVFDLESIVDKIADSNREIAAIEMERRKFLGEAKMKEVVRNSQDSDLDNAFRSINKVLQMVKLQKDTNELLLRQQMSYNNQMLNIINPRREMRTYNSYGYLSR